MENPKTLEDGATAQALQEMVIEEAIPVQTDPKKGGVTLAVADGIFDPWNPGVDLDSLALKFSNLTISEKAMVSGAFKEAREEMKKRASKLGFFENAKKDAKSDTSEETETFEKFKKTPISVIVKFAELMTGEKQKAFDRVKSDRLGTLRIKGEEWLHLKRGPKTSLAYDDGSPLGEKQPAGTFLYTLKIEDGTALRARTQSMVDPEENEKKKEQEPALVPVGVHPVVNQKAMATFQKELENGGRKRGSR